VIFLLLGKNGHYQVGIIFDRRKGDVIREKEE
jgi:hypothetical protein